MTRTVEERPMDDDSADEPTNVMERLSPQGQDRLFLLLLEFWRGQGEPEASTDLLDLLNAEWGTPGKAGRRDSER
jgi:hypothetical protein